MFSLCCVSRLIRVVHSQREVIVRLGICSHALAQLSHCAVSQVMHTLNTDEIAPVRNLR